MFITRMYYFYINDSSETTNFIILRLFITISASELFANNTAINASGWNANELVSIIINQIL
jgi:hypothetical protein